jgi:acyl-[acyl-carrier-protein]-phospholipid O-acyltransferase/long-chain-fatty-acid--[acyl-carrier-protein] ligase
MRSRAAFWSLIAAQFQGAFSDNVYRALVLFLLIGAGASRDERYRMGELVGVLFSLPYLVFSMAGGWLADRYSKRSVTLATRALGMVVMLVALAGLARGDRTILLVAVFLVGIQGALFGPAKYGLLPELLPHRDLSWGNGVLELGTFLAIILGTVGGSALAEVFRGRQWGSGLVLIALAAAGYAVSLGIARVPPADPARKLRLNFAAQLASELRRIRADRVLWLAVIGNAYFWFLATLLQLNVFFYGMDVLHASEAATGLLLVALAIGIGLGSFAAGQLSGRKVEYGLIPLGAIGITLFAAALSAGGLSRGGVALLLALLGFFAGFVAVPLNALIQHRPAADVRGAVIGAANLISFAGILAASGAHYAMAVMGGVAPPAVFLLSALLTVGGTVYAVRLLPDALLRLVLWLAAHTVYRIRVEGRDNVPEKGGALFVSNHLSLVDALLLLASTDRFVRFLMFKDYYEHPLIKPVASVMRAIPISSQLRPRDMIRSLREASETIKSGEIACIFAEGQITRTGQLLPFRRGFERIMKDVSAPIIPVHLDGVWGSIFSFERGRFLWKLPRRIPYPVTVSFGPPLPPTATAPEVRAAVQELHTSAYARHREWLEPLHRSLIRTARRHPFRFAMADGRTPRVRFGAVLTRSVFLARRLRRDWDAQQMVGILLPPSVGGALVNYAASLVGKVPVNLNYTASSETVAACARQCAIETVVTSREFLERVKITVPGRAIYLEDLAAAAGAVEKLMAAVSAWALPARFLERSLGRRRPAALDDLATVIFSSGSTGDPKGVMLSHFNVAANVEQIGQVFMLGGEDVVLGILPFFHSFGFTVTLWLPAVLGIGAIYHPNPLDARVIGALVARYAATFMVATPTFLQAYIRRCSPEDFGSLQYVVVGAEKLPERVARAFEDTFGLRPLEGYGCTECSPVVAVNARDFRAAGFRQVAAKRGKIGQPLPGITARIVDPETRQPMPAGAAGLLLVQGPNVMQGYLGKPDKTAEVLSDGWYVTGDIATVDEDGFLEITDRLSRFSKIGGEMVPHVKVEEKLHELAGATEQTFAVAGVPDERKGERLVVLHTTSEERLKETLDKLPAAGLPNLWVPRAKEFFRIDALPYLGTGKLDLRRVRELALKLSPGA